MPACEQQQADSRFIRRLNVKGEERTENITIQDYNGGLMVTHQNIYNDPVAQKFIFDALTNPGPADPERVY